MYVKSYIKDCYISDENLKKTEIISPITNKRIITFSNLTIKYVNEAYDYASFIQNKWWKITPKEKVIIFTNFAKLINESKNEFVFRMMQEIAKSKKDCEAEVKRTISLIYGTIQQYKDLLNSVSYRDFNNLSKIGFFVREPLGVVLTISPFNYPLNLAVSKILPSLIMGNTVVFKAASQGTWTGSLIVELLYKAGLLKGAIQFITGKGSEIGNDLVSNKSIAIINFTGSYEVGKQLSILNPMAKKIFELSGKDPAIILGDANIPNTISSIIKGAFSFSGQRCTAIKRILVHNSVAKIIEEEILKKTKELIVSRDVKNNPDIVPVINSSVMHQTNALLEDAIKKGAKLLLGKKAKDNLIYPIILTNVTKIMRIYKEEQFAPILPIIKGSSIENLVEIANDSEFGLGSSIFTKDYKMFIKIATQLKTARVTWNSLSARGPDNFPFTGIKHSGIGVQGIKDVLLESTFPKGYVLT